MSIEFYRGSPGKFDSRTLSRKTLNRWTGRIHKGTLASHIRKESKAGFPLPLSGPDRSEGTPLANRLAASCDYQFKGN